jgi:hypothetical protein
MKKVSPWSFLWRSHDKEIRPAEIEPMAVAVPYALTRPGAGDSATQQDCAGLIELAEPGATPDIELAISLHERPAIPGKAFVVLGVDEDLKGATDGQSCGFSCFVVHRQGPPKYIAL